MRLYVPKKTTYQQILKAGDVCQSAGADCVSFEWGPWGTPPNSRLQRSGRKQAFTGHQEPSRAPAEPGVRHLKFA
jgi:hypothetical protein